MAVPLIPQPSTPARTESISRRMITRRRSHPAVSSEMLLLSLLRLLRNYNEEIETETENEEEREDLEYLWRRRSSLPSR